LLHEGPVVTVSWVAYCVVAILLFGGWGFLGKLSLRHATWGQAGLVYGLATVVAFVLVVSLSKKRSFDGAGAWALVGSGICGALGLLAFYLALERGKAGAVTPLVSIYPMVTIAFATVFLKESVTPLQVVGIACALGGGILIGLGR
jgi:transporter family protein